MSTEQPTSRAKVRKIFKKGEAYLCGLCGKSFATLPEVQANLRLCTVQFLAEGGAVEAAPKRYRCSFCKRVHASMELARDCSTACRKETEDRIHREAAALNTASAEQKLKILAQFAKDPAALLALKAAEAQHHKTALPALGVYKPKQTEILAGENVKFVREKNLFRCLKCKQRYNSANEARSCWEGHGETYVSHLKPKSTDARYKLDGQKFRCSKCERLYGSSDDAIKCYETHVRPGENPSAGASTSPSPQSAKARKDEDKTAFYRDGAKYVCRKCSKKYFSRDEVMTCFRSVHTDEAVELDESEPTIDSPKVKPAKLKDDAEKFFRDGAKYVCRGCSKKYFSREETLACFAAHADEPSTD